MPDSSIHFQSGGPLHARHRQAVLLDRDKTLNEDPGYLNDPELVALLPGVVQGLQKLQAAGFLLIILSNQSGLGRGKISPEQLFAVNQRLLELLQREFIRIERIYYCPHTDDDGCNCRKPAPGLVQAALEDFQLEPQNCWIAGDRFRDLKCAEGAGIPGLLVGEEEIPVGAPLPLEAPANLIFHGQDLHAAADHILKHRSHL
ncbi:MAG: HAD family hydrolase [Leptospiraceae bacterium]|nr:HAD family hydrolase [Leptospiraceae bacterium]